MLRRLRLLRPELLCGVLALPLSAGRALADANETPHLVVAWPAGPMEVRVAFDRAIDPSLGTRLVGKSIHFDLRQRTLDAWRRQGSPPLSPPLGTLNVAAARLDAERRTLTLTTDPQPREAVYILDANLGATQPGDPEGLGGPIGYDLTGVSVSWAPGIEDAAKNWEGWWPELDPQTSQRITRNSREHDRGFEHLNQPGRTTLESLVVLPQGRVLLKLACSEPFEVSLNGENPTTQDKSHAEFVVESTGDPSALFMTVRTERADRPFSLRATYRGETDREDQVLARDRLSLPWAPPNPPSPPADSAPPPFPLAGGDRERGEALFHGDRAKCSNCHKVNGKGGNVGPELAPLASRSLEDLYREIAEPSATINPDFNAYTVALKDGRVLAGIVRASGAEALRVTDSDAKMVEVPRSEIEELRPSGTSMMPVGLVGAIGEQGTRDILAYLRASAPPPRAAAAPKP